MLCARIGAGNCNSLALKVWCADTIETVAYAVDTGNCLASVFHFHSPYQAHRLVDSLPDSPKVYPPATLVKRLQRLLRGYFLCRLDSNNRRVAPAREEGTGGGQAASQGCLVNIL